MGWSEGLWHRVLNPSHYRVWLEKYVVQSFVSNHGELIPRKGPLGRVSYDVVLQYSSLFPSNDVFELDIQNSTYYNRGNFTSVGGTATMLPSGIVVLAFGTNKLKSSPYKTDSVYLFNTITNKLTIQHVGGSTPQPRILATGTLGPDGDCSDTSISVTLNDTVKIDRTQAIVTPGLVVLNTSSWTWFYPNVSGPPSVDRFSAFSLLYENGNIVIGGGSTSNYNFSDISVLRNLPQARQSLETTTLEWYTNSDYDRAYGISGGSTDNTKTTDNSDDDDDDDDDGDDNHSRNTKTSPGMIVFYVFFSIGGVWFLFCFYKVCCG
ncbi:hypothetical protein K501DRAFT_334565 [Backusella circina FSU 941]|nr:hypothetical protein K501DRAFT_334565 [Backusella circina FSU 941]